MGQAQAMGRASRARLSSACQRSVDRTAGWTMPVRAELHGGRRRSQRPGNRRGTAERAARAGAGGIGHTAGSGRRWRAMPIRHGFAVTRARKHAWFRHVRAYIGVHAEGRGQARHVRLGGGEGRSVASHGSRPGSGRPAGQSPDGRRRSDRSGEEPPGRERPRGATGGAARPWPPGSHPKQR